MAYAKTKYYYDDQGIIRERKSEDSTHYFLEGDTIHSNSGSTHYYLGDPEDDGDRKIMSPGDSSTGFLWGGDGYIYGPSSDSVLPWMNE